MDLDKTTDFALRLAAEAAPTALEWVGGALWGEDGAEAGRAAGEFIRDSLR